MKQTALTLVTMSAALLVAAVLSSNAGTQSSAAKAIPFSADGESPAPPIVIGSQATASERFAAGELATYFGKMTGQTFKVVDDTQATEGNVIAVGKSKLTADLDIDSLEIEQYIIEVTANRLAIVGGRQPMLFEKYARDRGTLYGVYDVLESLGVRWYRPEPWGEHVPKLSSIVLPLGKQVSKKPDYLMRSSLGGGFTRCREFTPDMQDGASLWAARNRLNWSDVGEDPKLGGRTFYMFAHSYAFFIPPEEYFAKHPEYFALIDGKRTADFGRQLCLGNPEMQEEFERKVVEFAKANPQRESVSAEPNDSILWCQCDLCKAMDDPKTPKVMSNRVCAFNNIIAAKLAKEVPGRKLHRLAYWAHTAVPTKVGRLEPNTIIQLAPIGEWGDFTKKLEDSTSVCNARLSKALADWPKLQPSMIMSYEYWSGYAWLGPLPVTRAIADRVRNYRKFNVRGIYNESSPSWGPQGLEQYMGARLLWNPDIDVDKELDLYYKNFYGPAEKPMRAYHELLMDALARHKYPVYSGGEGIHLMFTPPLVEKLGRHIHEAQDLVKGHDLYERRLAGVAAGYEVARRVCEILKLKKAEGVETPMAFIPRFGAMPPPPGCQGSYLASQKLTRPMKSSLSICLVSAREMPSSMCRASPHTRLGH